MFRSCSVYRTHYNSFITFYVQIFKHISIKKTKTTLRYKLGNKRSQTYNLNTATAEHSYGRVAPSNNSYLKNWKWKILVQKLNRLSVFVTFWLQPKGLLAPFHDRRWNLGPPLHSQNQRAVQTMDTQMCFPIKENDFVNRKGYANCV